MSILTQNMAEFEKQIKTLEIVHPAISKYRQAGQDVKVRGSFAIFNVDQQTR